MFRVSVNLTNFSWPGGTGAIRASLGEVAAAADRGGLDTLWVNDHLLQAEPGTTVAEPMLEAYAVLGWLASRTERVRLGTMATGVSFRPAALLVKAVTTVDVLSGGRAWLGIGAGYHTTEAEAMGLPMPPTAERFALLDDTLALARRMWAAERGPFKGRAVAAADPVGSPLPVSRPGPPVLIGGAGEQRTLPLVARHADACNLFDIPDGGATLRHKLGVLERLCGQVGRPYEEIDKTVSTRFDPAAPVGEFVGRCRQFEEWGLTHAVCITRGPWTGSSVERLAEAAAALR